MSNKKLIATDEEQEKILKYLLSDKEIFNKNRKFIRQDYFSSAVLQWTFRYADGFLKDRKRFPSSEEIKNHILGIIEKEFEDNKSQKKLFMEKLKGFLNADIENENQAWLIETTKGFIKTNLLKDATLQEGYGNQDIGSRLSELENIWKGDTNRIMTQKIRSKDMERIECFWPGRIPSGKFNLIVGHPGVGKSIITMMIAAHVAMGKPWPDYPNLEVEKGRVFILSAEDTLKDTITPRLVAQGYNDKLGKIEMITSVDEDEKIFNFSRDIDKLDQLFQEKSDAKLLIVDPVSAYMGKVDTHKDSDVRRVLAPLKDIAERWDITIIGIMHLNKRSELENIVQRVIGSTGFAATARSVWLVDRDPESEQRYLIPVKQNLSKEKGTFVFELENKIVDEERGISAPKVVFQRNDKEITYVTILDRQKEALKAKKITEKAKAIKFLKKKMEESKNGCFLAADLIVEAKEFEGISEGSLNRARNELGLVSKREGGSDGRWVWLLEGEEEK